MCGIASIIYPDQLGETNIKKMLNRIKHRGDIEPNFESFGNSILGMVRLRIVDQENGKQPFYNEDNTVGVVFNGEIYNYKTLRHELILKSHKFHTDCDTEILVHLYEEYGKSFLLKLQGMFAFLIFDTRNNSFWAVRDFYGVKPLFWTKCNGTFYIASELKAFLDISVNEYFELSPGCYLTEKGITKYYDLPKPKWINQPISEVSCKVKYLVEDAVRKRVATDLPIAVFMGGGIDSAIVNILACEYHNDVTSIIIGSEQSEDVIYAKRLCKDFNLKYHYVPIDNDELIKSISEVIYATETFEPNPIRGSILSILLAKHAHDLGFKIVICGEGSDEIFGGYGDFLDISDENSFHNLIVEYLSDLYRTQLLRIDRTGMHYAVEVREPFLDRELVEYVLNILPSYKVAKNAVGIKTTKFILREAFKDILPDYIYNREKMTLMEGAGTGEVNNNKGILFQNAEQKVTDTELLQILEKYSEFNLLNKEDVINFRFFENHYLKAKFSKKRVKNAQTEIVKP